MHMTSLLSAELMCNYLAGNRFQLAMCFNIRMNQLTHTLPATLQRARKARRLSQLELALQLAVSQRHVSFVESGRAKPSRDLLTSRFATPHGELAFFSMFTTFGTPQDITLASLRVEHMFAGDEHTQAVVMAQVRIAETSKRQ
jgi:DNA-binding XRE family transcriptional regulator